MFDRVFNYIILWNKIMLGIIWPIVYCLAQMYVLLLLRIIREIHGNPCQTRTSGFEPNILLPLGRLIHVLASHSIKILLFNSVTIWIEQSILHKRFIIRNLLKSEKLYKNNGYFIQILLKTIKCWQNIMN